MKTLVEQLLAELNKADNIYIFSHVNTDGDALGSCGAFVLSLRQLGFEKSYVVLGERPTKTLEPLLPPKGMYMVADEVNIVGKEGDLAVCLDASTIERLKDDARKVALGCGRIVKIDHHIQGKDSAYADVEISDADWAATCEGLYDILKLMGVVIDKEIAMRLYWGILTDSGRFTFSNTTGDTLRIVAALVDILGTNLTWIAERNYDKNSEATLRLHGVAFRKMEVLAGGKLVAVLLNNRDFKSAGAELSDSHSVAAELLKVEGAVMSIFIRPTSMADDEIEFKASMRCSEGWDVSEICGYFGGGGHKCAAGATIEGDEETVYRMAVSCALEHI